MAVRVGVAGWKAFLVVPTELTLAAGNLYGGPAVVGVPVEVPFVA